MSSARCSSSGLSPRRPDGAWREACDAERGPPRPMTLLDMCPEPRPITIALVNHMRGAAFLDTEMVVTGTSGRRFRCSSSRIGHCDARRAAGFEPDWFRDFLLTRALRLCVGKGDEAVLSARQTFSRVNAQSPTGLLPDRGCRSMLARRDHRRAASVGGPDRYGELDAQKNRWGTEWNPQAWDRT
jgi:hypothetical protein